MRQLVIQFEFWRRQWPFTVVWLHEGFITYEHGM